MYTYILMPSLRVFCSRALSTRAFLAAFFYLFIYFFNFLALFSISQAFKALAGHDQALGDFYTRQALIYNFTTFSNALSWKNAKKT